MTTQRRTYSADPDRVAVREPTDEDDADGLFRIRMPVSSTAEARDGDAFSRDRLEGWVRQIDAGDVGVFLDHGRNHTTGSRYSALGKLGYWADPAVEDRDGGAELVADAVLMDPAELDADLGDLRMALETLRAQATAGVPLASSVGWSEDTGDRDLPGDSDLLEISIVGIPSDPNTTTASAEPAAMARAVSAAASDFDVEQFVRAYEQATGTTARNIDDPEFSPGDAVMWTWQDEPVHGRVNDIHEQYTPPEADEPITGEEGEAVYSIYEYDDETEELSETPNVGKPESSLSESEKDIPTRDTMTDDDTPEEGDENRDEPTLRDMEQKMDEVREMCERMESMQEEMYEEMMGGSDEEAMDDEDGDEDGSEDDDDEEESADAGDRTVTIDGEERDLDGAAAHIRELRDEAGDADLDDSKTQNRATDGSDSDTDETDSGAPGYGFAGMEE